MKSFENEIKHLLNNCSGFWVFIHFFYLVGEGEQRK